MNITRREQTFDTRTVFEPNRLRIVKFDLKKILRTFKVSKFFCFTTESAIHTELGQVEPAEESTRGGLAQPRPKVPGAVLQGRAQLSLEMEPSGKEFCV
jgi:hypothetical protein